MNVYCPDKFANIIREKRRAGIEFNGSGQLNFPTWSEAHAWLIAEREKQASMAAMLADRARRQLANARKMKPPIQTERPAREGDTQ